MTNVGNAGPFVSSTAASFSHATSGCAASKGSAIASFAHLESDEMFGCGAGFHHLFIDAVGNVCPCDLTPLALGNVLQQPLDEIWTHMSQWFDLPRCGCLMKHLCTETNAFNEGPELPLDQKQSEELCSCLSRDEKLPQVFANLFRDRKPTNPPMNQP